MEGSIGQSGTRSVHEFLRSFSVISEQDSDFEELPDLSADIPDGPDGPASLFQPGETYAAGGKEIPFNDIHKDSQPFTTIRNNCWIPGTPIRVKIVNAEKHNAHIKIFNPILYTVQVTHGEFQWTVRRRYKHFFHLHQQLRLYRMRLRIPVPTRAHRERRQSVHGKRNRIPRFPKKPEVLVRDVDKRKNQLEDYLQNLLQIQVYKNHMETLKFLEVSHLSFVKKLGKKYKEGAILKCSGGRHISIGCCGCLKKFHFAGRWNKRWLLVKDSFVAYVRPSDGRICDVMLMDSNFRVETGMGSTGAPHGLLISNLTRNLLAKCWTGRKAEEWKRNIDDASKAAGKDYMQENRFESFAPVRESSYARWFADGATYFAAVAEALDNAKEEIFITDWWLSPEIYLKRPITDGNHWRLDITLERKAKQGVKIFILLYKEMSVALNLQSIYSKHCLASKSPENIKILRHPDHIKGGVLLWAHHEKIVAIDQKIAFLGGLDLCYGRWDDSSHRLVDLGCIVYEGMKQTSTDLEGKLSVDKKNTEEEEPDVLNSSGISFNFVPPSPSVGSIESVNPEEVILTECKEDSTVDQDGDTLVTEGQHQVEEEEKDLEDECSCHKCRTDENRHSYSNSSMDEEEAAELLKSSAKLKHNKHTNIVDPNSGQGSHLPANNSNKVVEVTVHQENDEAENSVQLRKSCSHNNDSDLSHDNRNSDELVPSAAKVSSSEEEKTDEESCELAKLVSKEKDTNKTKKKPSKEDHMNTPKVTFKQGDSEIEIDNNNDKQVYKKHLWKSRVKYNEKWNKTIDRDSDSSVACNAAKTYNSKLTEVKKEANGIKDASGEPVQLKSYAKVDWTNSYAKPIPDKTSDKEDSIIVPEDNITVLRKPEKVEKDSSDGGGGGGDGTGMRDSWAMRKLRRTLSRNRQSSNEGDQVGTVGLSDSDHLRNKWRLVLNIQKFESSIKRQEQTPLPKEEKPDSPKLTARIHMKSTLMKQNFQERFKGGHRDSLTFHNKEELNLPVALQRTSSEIKIDELGLKGSSKFWIGKDYVNFIHKDFVDLHNPFEDFIDRSVTPRMPWHDIGAVVYGKAARDVSRHFIGRWNCTKVEKAKGNRDYPLLVPKSYTAHNMVPRQVQEVCDEVKTQILRSACSWSAGIKIVERSIQSAYLHCIANAKHFIYIENQFFITLVGDHSVVRNEIGEALFKRIVKAHSSAKSGQLLGAASLEAMLQTQNIEHPAQSHYIDTEYNSPLFLSAGETFRVFVVMPLLPAFEGKIGESGAYAIKAVSHWNYVSISKGNNSLWTRLQKEGVMDPLKYLVFCGLRTAAELSGKLITELIYVHSKLMIVDDDVAIIGSANINDRSMSGDRDSEIAVLVEDIHKTKVKFDGKDHMVGKFASSLRKNLFREHLGLGKDVNIDDPVSDQFYKHLWIQQATINTTVFQKVFNCIPDDKILSFAEFDEYSRKEKMAEKDPEQARHELNKIKGHLVLLPLHFLEHESSIIPTMGRESLLPTSVWT